MALVLLGAITAAAHAEAQPAPINCPVPNQWNFIPYNDDVRRFPVDAANAVNASGYSPADRYANNIDYGWQMWFSSNVTQVQLVFSRFELESGYDKFLISDRNGTMVLTGVLDNYGFQTYTTPALFPVQDDPSYDDNFLNLRFTSDVSVDDVGWALKGVNVWCGTSNQPALQRSTVSQYHANMQLNGVLLGSGDVRYFKTLQKAGNGLFIHVKPDTPYRGRTAYDLDLYVSPTDPFPSPTSNTQSSTRGTNCKDRPYPIPGFTQEDTMCEDAVYVQPVSYDRIVYWAVRSFSGAGAYRAYANNVAKTLAFTVGVEGVNYKSWAPQGQTPMDQTQNILNLLRASSGAFYQATDGTAVISRWEIYNNVPKVTDNVYGCGGSPCNIRLVTFGEGGSCSRGYGLGGAASCGFSVLQGSVYDGQWWGNLAAGEAALGIVHELGHCYYNMTDEYDGCPPNGGAKVGGIFDGHSIMNSSHREFLDARWPTSWPQDFCTDSNHRKDEVSGGLGVCSDHQTICTSDASCPNLGTCDKTSCHGSYSDPLSGWAHMKACSPSQFAVYYVTGTPDPETWYNSDIWADSRLTVIHENP
jgi:hypothetical protein